MARLTLPQFVLRRRQRSSARAFARFLALEQLDKRIVLSGVPDAACIDIPAESAPHVEIIDSASDQVSVESASPVYVDAAGVLHVQPVSDETNIVVRQYVNYQLLEVVEVEMAGEWTAAPADQVQQVQVHQVNTDQQVVVEDGVVIPVQLIDPEAVEAVFAFGGEDVLASDLETAFPLVDPPMQTGPEGEGPGRDDEYSGWPPEIVSFDGHEVDGYWEFTGQVTDDMDVEGLVVVFGGLLDGFTATVNAQGIFTITASFPPGTQGAVTAITTDADGMESNEAYCGVNM